MTDPRNPTSNPTIAKKLLVADLVAENRELASKLYSKSANVRNHAIARRAELVKLIEEARASLNREYNCL